MALVTSVQERQDILEGPLTGAVFNPAKARAWVEVTAAVNAKSKTLRSAEEVKSKYIDFKSYTKKKLRLRQKQLLATGKFKY